MTSQVDVIQALDISIGALDILVKQNDEEIARLEKLRKATAQARAQLMALKLARAAFTGDAMETGAFVGAIKDIYEGRV